MYVSTLNNEYSDKFTMVSDSDVLLLARDLHLGFLSDGDLLNWFSSEAPPAGLGFTGRSGELPRLYKSPGGQRTFRHAAR